jgi:lactate permease
MLPLAVWTQQDDPFGSPLLSTLAAALPVAVLLGLLVSGRANAWQSALAGLATAALVAFAGFGMPAPLVAAAAAYGLVFALFRIVWLIVAAVFLYNVAVESGQFEVMKASIARLSPDRRIQAVLVAFCFGAFLEGAAGFGAPVAITAAFLTGLGFHPFTAALLCLVANTAPVAWGSVGIPLKTLGGVTGLDVEALSATAGRILPPLSLLIPLWLVRLMVPWRQTLQVAPFLLAVGGTFAAVQCAWSNLVGVDLVDLASAAASLLAGVVFLRVWQPAQPYRFASDDEPPSDHAASSRPLTARDVARAWLPFLLLSLAVLAWGLPSIKKPLDALTSWNVPLPALHHAVARSPAFLPPDSPPESRLEDAILPIVPVTATGTAVFLAAVASALILGLGPRTQARLLLHTVVRLIPAMVTIFAMLALGFVTRYAGIDAVLGLAFTRTGRTLYPLFGTLLGWLGVALTGSDTASNVLFGNLQALTARQLGLNPILMAAANSTGGVMGKMIDAQSIVVAAAATGESGQEGRLLRAVLPHSLALAVLTGIIVWTYAHWLPGWVAAPVP